MKKTQKLLSVFFAFVMLFSITSAVPLITEAASLPKTSISSITAYPSGFNVSMKAQKNVTGYQVQYSTSSKFKNAKSVRTTKTTSAIRKLSSAKKYYVRVRTYKKSGKKYTYSAWSASKSITTLNKNASNPAHIKSLKAGHASFTTTTYTSSNATRYQVRYSTNKSMSGSKTVTSKTNSVTISSLSQAKTYYVQSRTYRTVKGKNYYSAWSPTKTIKTQSHSYTAVYKTEPVYTNVPIYKEEPIYEEQPIYEEVPIYEQQPVMKEMQCFYCGGCHVDCRLEARRLGYADFSVFHGYHETGYDGLSCPNTYGNKGAMICGSACGLPTHKMYQVYIDGVPQYETVQVGTERKQVGTKTVQVGTKKTQIGTEKKQTGTKKVLTGYKCSCGATKKA